MAHPEWTCQLFRLARISVATSQHASRSFPKLTCCFPACFFAPCSKVSLYVIKRRPRQVDGIAGWERDRDGGLPLNTVPVAPEQPRTERIGEKHAENELLTMFAVLQASEGHG
ncbi:hypothetical protein HaLaN_27966 [Haematococcus lacustris]|uniref:Uncharacterized protein n=1 Tax=Haematococcus lacustris TaxID=44745 RepID=A0A6A0A9K3_HAELA|nr:hypothetical protein HaLaN_27966 [Haematococcus lacustris]